MTNKLLKSSKRNTLSEHASSLMPRTKSALSILKKRGELLAKQTLDVAKELNLTPYIKFRLGNNNFFGISYDYAVEIMPNTIVTPLPSTPVIVPGLVNRRGTLLPVIDLKSLFYTSKIDTNKNHDIIVVQYKNYVVGLLADEIVNSDQYDLKKLQHTLSTENKINHEFILGLDKSTTAILNLEAILKHCEATLKR